MEQRYQAVLEVLGGATVVDVARRYGVARQTVHGWLRRYASDGLAGLVDRSSRPDTCPQRGLTSHTHRRIFCAQTGQDAPHRAV